LKKSRNFSGISAVFQQFEEFLGIFRFLRNFEKIEVFVTI
jgi:hypothetical protein